MSMKINIEAVDSTMKSLPPVTTAKARFDNAGGHEETDPIERLRFFCSKAMSGQDWLDVEPFFDAAIAERGTLAAKLAELAELAELEGQTENLLSACHRLALELECLLLDTKDSASVSRWWDSAMAALDEWHKVKDSVSAEQPMNAAITAAQAQRPTDYSSMVDRAWARFCGAFGDGPYPGMIAAFETHYGQSFRDKEWRTEAACWAAAWSKATARADAKNDSYRLDALEAVAKASGTGVSFDWCRHVEDGMVVEHGYRMMWKHTIGPREKSIRHAIDAAMGVFKP